LFVGGSTQNLRLRERVSRKRGASYTFSWGSLGRGYIEVTCFRGVLSARRGGTVLGGRSPGGNPLIGVPDPPQIINHRGGSGLGKSTLHTSARTETATPPGWNHQPMQWSTRGETKPLEPPVQGTADLETICPKAKIIAVRTPRSIQEKQA